jgi:hypothetical protein
MIDIIGKYRQRAWGINRVDRIGVIWREWDGFGDGGGK